jgi:hypothetical protein
MKKLIIYLTVVIVAVGITGCYKDVIYPDVAADPDGPPQAVSFSAEVAPLLNTKCAIAGCHVSGAHSPVLTTSQSYQALVNGGYVNVLLPKESILYKMINGEMREYIPLSADRQKVYDWIRNGALNN